MVGVCIKYMHENYGGILQAYATVSYLENQNIEYELVRYTRKKTVTEALKDVPRLFNAVWFNSRFEGIQRKLSLKKHPEYAKNNEVRMKAFAGFKKWAFKDFSDEYIGYAALREGGKKYSAVITGSDQLWSPAGLPTNYYNLMFVPDDTLKISIASSFGVKEIPWYQKKRTIRIRRKSVSFNAIKKLVVNGIWNSINSLGNTLNSGLDLIVTNLWLSDLAMGQIAITKTISSIFMSFNQLLAQPFQPLFLKSYSDGNKEKLISELKLSMKLTGLFSSIVFAGFFSLGKVFYALWIPGQDIDLIYVLTVITMLASVVEGPIYPLYYIYTLTVRNKIPCIITVIGGILNVAGMAILVKYSSLGIYSIVLTTTVIMLFINLVTNPIYMTYCLKVKWFTFYPTLLRTVISCVCITASFILIADVLNPHTWVTFLLTAGLCGVLGCIIHLILVFSKDEKQQLLLIAKNKNK